MTVGIRNTNSDITSLDTNTDLRVLDASPSTTDSVDILTSISSFQFSNTMATSSASTLLKEAASARSTNPKRAEQLYKQILETTAKGVTQGDRDQSLRDQEEAMIKLGELYRDQKYVNL